MGNNHSSPICDRLCPGATRPPLKGEDEDEWFDTSKKKKSKKTYRKTVKPKMAPVPEDEDEDDAVLDNRESEATTLTRASSSGSNPSDTPKSAPRVSAKPLESEHSDKTERRRYSDGHSLKNPQTRPSPGARLIFVNGQFIDVNTVEGKEMADAAKAAEAAPADQNIRLHEILGVEASIYAGHGKLLSKDSDCMEDDSDIMDTLTDLGSNIGQGFADIGSSIGLGIGKMGRKTVMPRGRKTMIPGKLKKISSDVSQGSSKGSGGSKSDDSNEQEKSHNAVTSIISLGEIKDGFFLTASKYDRAIKMWRASDKSLEPDGSNAKPEITFVRDFVGHKTGVTTLARVCSKGRFLSASKCGQVILWDSRYDCGDDDEEEAVDTRIILAKFNKMDRRALETIAMIEAGSYVRPDDDIDFAMLKAACRKTFMGGSAGLQQAAREKHILECSADFATITGHHKEVKIWSMKHIEQQEGLKLGDNCVEVTLDQEIKNDQVVQSLTSLIEKGLILTGDRMGSIKIWHGGRNMMGGCKEWTCDRAFNTKKTKLLSVDQTLELSVTALTFVTEDIFLSGSHGGVITLWDAGSQKELVKINGTHKDEIVDIKLGRVEEQRKSSDTTIYFSSASSDAKVLSFILTIKKNEKCKPICYDVVDHSITQRYLSNRKAQSVEALALIEIQNTSSSDMRKAMLSASSGGDINLLKVDMSFGGQTKDALLQYREHIEEEARALYTIAPDLLHGVELKNRKKHLMKYKDCFLGCDAVSYLINKGHAISRRDALDLGRVLASRFDLFTCATDKGKLLEDDNDDFYRYVSCVVFVDFDLWICRSKRNTVSLSAFSSTAGLQMRVWRNGLTKECL